MTKEELESIYAELEEKWGHLEEEWVGIIQCNEYNQTMSDSEVDEPRIETSNGRIANKETPVPWKLESISNCCI